MAKKRSDGKDDLSLLIEMVSDTRADQKAMYVQIDSMKEDICELCKVVRDGNGQPSLTQRLTALEEKNNAQSSWLREVADSANKTTEARWLANAKLLGVLLVAVTSLLVALLTK